MHFLLRGAPWNPYLTPVVFDCVLEMFQPLPQSLQFSLILGGDSVLTRSPYHHP